MIKPIDKNTLFYGDNLPILRDYIADESVDLIYLDPPFNSNRSYNVLFKDESGKDSESQITAFEDTWHWGQETEETYHALIQNAPARVSSMISSLREFVGANQMMAYLVMMTARLIELQRVTGSHTIDWKAGRWLALTEEDSPCRTSPLIWLSDEIGIHDSAGHYCCLQHAGSSPA